jgi:hypothetical protein
MLPIFKALYTYYYVSMRSIILKPKKKKSKIKGHSFIYFIFQLIQIQAHNTIGYGMCQIYQN